jgi:hypothetical protein
MPWTLILPLRWFSPTAFQALRRYLMEQANNKSIEDKRPIIYGSTRSQKGDEQECLSYRALQLLVVGKAVDLVQRSYPGTHRDGSSGWWIWC